MHSTDPTSLTDEYLDEMRSEPKYKVSATRSKVKGKSNEQQFECRANSSEHRVYRVFTRQNIVLPSVFSVGMTIVQTGSDLILCRYNSGHHPHRNVLERERVPATPHIHVATQRRHTRSG